MQIFQQWLNRLASEVNLEEPLVLDDKQQCFLMFDEALLVTIELNTAESVFSFKASLGNVNEWQIKRIYPRLLEANLQWRETYGATLGLQQFSDKVLLVQHTPLLNCDYEIFEKSLECFVNTFEYWVQNLKILQHSTKENPKETSAYSSVQA
ncbi:MAG: type III secretion system chaperone [Puniceicoccales bacterium]|nr:type III secretion system chaperone [Puniceicoccales bacterium]